MRPVSWGLVAVTMIAVVVGVTSPAAGSLTRLPGSGGKVNNDVANGIDPTRSVSGEDPNSDLVAASVTAKGRLVPWVVFRDETSGADQLFVRRFDDGRWTTEGDGTVGGVSSQAPMFGASLNFDQGHDGEDPSIAVVGHTVWATWDENQPGTSFDANNVFASQLNPTTGKWRFAGQDRGTGGGPVAIPSLNLQTDLDAEAPSIAAGAASPSDAVQPWVAFDEQGTSAPRTTQIYVERGLGPGLTSCVGIVPAESADSAPAGGRCWQQVGIPRVGSGTNTPSLNVDPTRNAIEPDLSFAGSGDRVPWVVWTEIDTSSSPIGLHSNAMVFAGRGEADPTAGLGGLHWTVVGRAGAGELLPENAESFGPCSESFTAESRCSLNADPDGSAEDPQVAAGTMTAGATAQPWVVWSEQLDGVFQIYVARLVAGRFALVNAGNPISGGSRDATRPAIAFDGHTPYVTWRSAGAGTTDVLHVGHFVDAAVPRFIVDSADTSLTSHVEADARQPIASACAPTVLTRNGSSCPAGAVGTPFLLYTAGQMPTALYAATYQPTALTIRKTARIGESAAQLRASINPQGAAVEVYFEYGRSGKKVRHRTAEQRIGPTTSLTSLRREIHGLKPGVRYRVVVMARTDFRTIASKPTTFRTKTNRHKH